MEARRINLVMRGTINRSLEMISWDRKCDKVNLGKGKRLLSINFGPLNDLQTLSNLLRRDVISLGQRVKDDMKSMDCFSSYPVPS